MKRANYWMAALLLALSGAGEAMAAVCTTNAGVGNWNTASTWSCGHVPLTTDTVVISRNITLDASRTVAGLTINAGVVLNDAGRTLTVTGNVINNGTFGTNGGALSMTGANTTLSGTGTFNDTDVEIDAMGISLPAGSTMEFANQAQLRVGNNNQASFTLNGAITGAGLASGDRIVRVYQNSSMTINGSINAPNAYIRMEQNASVTNNGSVTVQYLRTDAATSVWTQGVNSSLTVTQTPAGRWSGVLNASAAGNTVTYNGTATPLTPSANTYYNLAGAGVTCPHGFIVLGTSPCVVIPGVVTVTASPTLCVNDATVGTRPWASGLTNVGSSNNLYATSVTTTATGTQLTNFLKCTGYGFAIPAGATINGIAVGAERKISSTNRTTTMDNAVRVVKAGVIGATDRSTATPYTTADAFQAHGGAADLWGLAWTPADINAITFGAAFSANVTKTRTGTRTVSVDHMPITVTYSTPPAAPDHIRIEHDGSGQTCRAETLTVTACANAACTAPHLSTATVTGNVTWAGSPGGSIPFTIASGGTGQTTVLLPVATAQTVTLGTSAVSPAQTNPPSTCTNSGGGGACSIVFSAAASCFDTVEVGAAIATPIYTKRSGTAFSLDVLASSAYSGTLQVELVNSAAGTCAGYASLNTQSTTFTSQTRKTLSFNYANAAKNVRVRITGLAGSSCSTDRFAIRPSSLTVTSSANADATGTSAVAVPAVKAGAAFTLNAAAVVAGYDGTPMVDNTKLTAHAAAVANGTLSGMFGAANPVTGTAAGSGFDYSEAGYFRLGIDGVYDSAFTAVDQPNDCTNDFSNTLAGGKYGCKFGNSAASNYFGRFVPDHFDTVINEVTGTGIAELACADGYTYAAQPFILEVTARNSGSVVTQNYTGNYAKAVTLSDGNAVPGGALNNTALAAAAFLAGVGNTPDPTGAISPNYTFAVVQTAPVTILLRATENAGGDGVSSSAGAEDTMEIRSGRLVLGNAHGSELLGLTIPITTQYWTAGGYYATNVDDDCTVIPASSIAMGTYTRNLAACETQLAPIGDLVFSGGQLPAPLQLSAPGAGNNGSVDLMVNVGPVAAGNTCLGAMPSLATAANVPWLATNTARATFGVYKGANEFIYLRENY